MLPPPVRALDWVMQRKMASTGWIAAAVLAAPGVLAQPLMPRPLPRAEPSPGAPRPSPPPRPLAPPDPNEVDWRGLGDAPKKKTPHDDAVAALIRNAPYRVEVATSDGVKVSLSNALTLERRRVFDGPNTAAFGFSPDGAWLYVATASGELFAVDPDSAAQERLGKVPLAAEQSVVEIVGAGGATQQEFTVLLGTRTVPSQGPCPTWRDPQRLHVRHSAGTKAVAMTAAQPGWAEPPEANRTAPTSPNTKYRAAVRGAALVAEARFGGGDFRLSRTALPNHLQDLQWMRDSAGVVATFARKATGTCRQRPGLRVWRDDPKPGAVGWQEWTLPDAIEVARPDLRTGLQWASDGMRLLGVEARGVVLIEPAPRFRGTVALIAPPSTIWPKFRPGVRPLTASAPPALRHAEILLEQGDLDAAARKLRLVKETEARALTQRLKKLEEVRQRRAEEWNLDLAELRSDKTQHGPPRPPQPPLPAPAPMPAPLPQPVTPVAAPPIPPPPPPPAADPTGGNRGAVPQ